MKEIVEKDFKGKLDFVAQNVKTNDFGDPVFSPYVIRPINGIPVAIIGQAFPYTPIANPRYMVADWAFGIQDENMQKMVDEARGKGAQLVVVLSHNGMDVDLKMASRVRGIDAIFGGHTHDGVPVAVPVKNPGGTTLVTNAGSNGKFLGLMDFDVKGGKLVDFRYRLLPVFANQLPADPAMEALITRVRAPYEAKLAEKLAVTDGLLYRRGNFNGSWDQLICDAMMEVQGADIAFSPGFRWGTSLLPGDTITRELMMDQLAITYPYATLTSMTGETIKTILEDVADNLFNPDPYYQQGGDMVRIGGLAYTMRPEEKMGSRISDMRLNGKLIEAGKSYKVAGWAPVAEEARTLPGVKPIWDHVETWLKAQGGRVTPRRINTPHAGDSGGEPRHGADLTASPEAFAQGAFMSIKHLLASLVLAVSTATVCAQDAVVYHVDNAVAQGLKGLRNIRNHLDTDSAAKITVVTHAEGVDMLMEGAKAANGTEYAPLVSALKSRGVVFEVCEITLKNRSLKKEQFIQEADFTPSGVVRLAKLQKQGFAYIKP